MICFKGLFARVGIYSGCAVALIILGGSGLASGIMGTYLSDTVAGLLSILAGIGMAAIALKTYRDAKRACASLV